MLAREQVDQIKETFDRTRRIETRLTRYLEAKGFETKVQKPLWDRGTVQIPSMACSVKDILEAIPPGVREAAVSHQGTVVLELKI